MSNHKPQFEIEKQEPFLPEIPLEPEQADQLINDIMENFPTPWDERQKKKNPHDEEMF